MNKPEELLYRARLLRKESEKVEDQLNFVNQQISELEDFRECLSTLEENDEMNILASLGKGVYAKARREDDRLFVSVGAGVIVRKTVEEADKDVKEQLGKFKEARTRLSSQIEKYAMEFGEIAEEVESL